MKKLALSKKIKYLSLVGASLVATSAIFIQPLTSCSHVYTDQFIRNNATKINPSNAEIIIDNSNIDTSLNESEIINQFWGNNDNLRKYKDIIANKGVFENTPITGSDISIPYSSVNVKKDAWGTKIYLQAYTRVFNYDGIPVNLPYTSFPQHSDYNGSEFRINVDQKEHQKWYQSIGNWPALANYIVDYQKNVAKLFDSIPSGLQASDIDITDVQVSFDDIDKNTVINITFNLKCLYSKENLNQQKFILHVGVNSASSQFSLNKDGATIIPMPENSGLVYGRDIKSGGGNNMRHWINDHECSTQVVFSFKK